MTKSWKLLGICSVGAIAASLALAQPGDKTKTPTTPKPTDGKMQPPGKDGMGADMQAQMKKAMEEAAMVTEWHKWLQQGTGTWDGKCKFWMDPSGEPQESTCTSTCTSFMDGRFSKCEVKGTMKDMDNKSVPFEGLGIFGYNNATQQFEQTWCDSMGTMQMHLTGKLSDDKKTMTWESKYFCPIMHQDTWMRQVETRTGPDSMTLEFWGPDMTGKGTEFKMGEIKFTRKAGTGPKGETTPMKKH